jgi:hypothetical protein
MSGSIPTSGNDSLTGGNDADTIDLLAGNDSYLGLAGMTRSWAGMAQIRFVAAMAMTRFWAEMTLTESTLKRAMI